MAGKIPAQFIDSLIDQVDIVDLVNSRVPLKKAGKDYHACCPFHDEKTPSFTVSQEKQFYHCFGCGAHGTAIGFLMEYDNLGFVDAIEELASRNGLEVPREQGSIQGPDLRPLYETTEKANQFFLWQLRKHPNASVAVDYLKQRGFSGDIAAQFEIGFAPPGWDNLIQYIGQGETALTRLRDTGMISEPEANKCYDRFRDRIMFPIRNHRGKIIGFGGRIIGDGKPKYLNSPETKLFHKGKELYGLYEARKANKSLQRLLIVEGYLDVIALAQHGINYSVATLGTATTSDHIKRLFQSTSEIVFCFDGDRAGREAGWKALLVLLPLFHDGHEARFLFLPDGEDPDTQIRQEGAEQFSQRIETAPPLSDFLFQQLMTQVDMESLAGRAKLSELANPLLAKLPSGVFREMMLKKLAQLIGVDSHEPHTHNPTPSRAPSRKSSGGRQTMTPVRLAIALLLTKPQLALDETLPTEWPQLDAPGVKLLSQLLELIQNQPNLSTAQIIERWREQEAFRHLEKLWQIGEAHPVPQEGIAEEFSGALRRLNEQYREQETTQLLSRVSSGEASEQEKLRLTQLLSK